MATQYAVLHGMPRNDGMSTVISLIARGVLWRCFNTGIRIVPQMGVNVRDIRVLVHAYVLA